MRKQRLFSIAVFAAFITASIFVTACKGPNNPKPETTPETKPAALQVLEAGVFSKAPEGTTYTGYKITWTDAQGKTQTKEVTMDEVKNGIVLTGGLQEGSKPTVTPYEKLADGSIKYYPDAAQEVSPSAGTDWKLYIQAGIDELGKDKPDYDAALAKFKDAYNAEKNNTTKAYYATAQLASISVKPAAVNFMRNKMGFATYPAKLNALINLDWFKDETRSQTRTGNSTISISTPTFSKSSSFNYKRVKGHIADTPDATKVSIPVNGNLARFEMGTVGPLAGKWSELGYNALLKKIIDTPLKDRKSWYSHYDSPDSGKYLIVDAFDDAGTYLVGHSDVHEMQGYDAAQGYSSEDWNNFITYEYQYEEVSTWHVQYPQLQPAADWYKDFDPLLQIPAYIIEHSDSANVDQLIDELYGILFGSEFAEASAALNSLDASKPITIDKKLIKVLYMDGNIFAEGADVQLQKDQLLGIIGGLTAVKGVFELLQSYSFNTDLNILKWNWDKDDEILKNLGNYNQAQDPFNNGFFKGRDSQKIADAKADIVKGADLLLAAYESLTNSETLPADAKAKVKEYTDFAQVIVKEIRNAVQEGKTANLLVGENNPLKEDIQVFTIDMGKAFTYEYFKLMNLFEMNESKPKIHPADSTHSSPYMMLTFERFMNDFVTIKIKDGGGGRIFEDSDIPLSGTAGEKIINFYK